MKKLGIAPKIKSEAAPELRAWFVDEEA